MPSNAFSVYLAELLQDAIELDEAHSNLSTGSPGRQYGLGSLNRSAVVIGVSAWESYVEELMRECLQVLRPVGPSQPWTALNAYALGLLGRFHTPNSANVAALINNALSLPDVRLSWGWQNCTSAQAVARLDGALNQRHEIAHGVNPRPIIHNRYSNELTAFISRLARCTDRAVRSHLINVLGVVAPWPP